MLHMSKKKKILLLFLFLLGWFLFFMTNSLVGYVINYEFPLLIIPLMYIISSGLCWIPVMLVLIRPRVIHKEVIVEKEVKGKSIVIEKPVIVEKIVEKEVSVEKPVVKTFDDDRMKDYFIGSKETSKYHMHGCKWVDGIYTQHREYFKTQEKAKNAGFKKCKSCLKP